MPSMGVVGSSSSGVNSGSTSGSSPASTTGIPPVPLLLLLLALLLLPPPPPVALTPPSPPAPIWPPCPPPPLVFAAVGSGSSASEPQLQLDAEIAVPFTTTRPTRRGAYRTKRRRREGRITAHH